MNKTQLLSDTENLIYCLGKTHYIIQQIRLLYTVQIQGQVTPKMITGSSFAPSFLETPHTFSTIQNMESK
jgi:hypothetical protein